MKKSQNPRIRWHVSEEVATEMSRKMKVAGMKSWDDFFRAMMERWDAAPGELPAPSAKRLEGIRQILREELDARESVNESLLRELQKLEAQHDIQVRLITRFTQFMDWIVQSKEPMDTPSTPSGKSEALKQFMAERRGGGGHSP